MVTLGECTTVENAQNIKERKLFKKIMELSIQFKIKNFSKK